MDEAWLFIRNETIRSYIVQAQKTWRKHNAAMILATQSIKELEESGMLQIVSESCPTKIFLANPEMDRDLYREAFHLNDTELELIAGLVPPGQMLIRKAQVLQEGSSERRFGLALDGDQQCPRQPEEARVFRALRDRRGLAPSRRRLSVPATHAGRAQPPPTAKEARMNRHSIFLVLARRCRFLRCRRAGRLGAHRSVPLAGHRADPRQAQVHDAD